METTIIEYLITQGPGWVMAGIVGLILWGLVKYYRKRDEKQQDTFLLLLQKQQEEGDKRNARNEARMQQMADDAIAQQKEYSAAWEQMTRESLKVQAEFTKCMGGMRGDLTEALNAVRGAITIHNGKATEGTGELVKMLKEVLENQAAFHRALNRLQEQLSQ